MAFHGDTFPLSAVQSTDKERACLPIWRVCGKSWSDVGGKASTTIFYIQHSPINQLRSETCFL